MIEKTSSNSSSSEMLGKCSEMFVLPSQQFWKIYGNLRKMVESLRKIVKNVTRWLEDVKVTFENNMLLCAYVKIKRFFLMLKDYHCYGCIMYLDVLPSDRNIIVSYSEIFGYLRTSSAIFGIFQTNLGTV